MKNKRYLHLISNTHWDREWYMSFESFRLRLVRLFDRLLAVLSANTGFRSFLLDGQFSALEDYLELRPEKEAEIRGLVQSGKLEIGPWYTQPHETMAGGEAIIRNLMRGIRASRRFGPELPISYNIDQFGHISQMPQILRGFGIGSAVGWRGVPLESPAVFRWIGPDGSAVNFFYSNGGYGEATALPESLGDFTEVCEQTAFARAGLRGRIEKLLALRTPNSTGPHLLCLSGIDHAFAQENLPQVIALINRECPGVQAVHSTLREYTDAVQNDLTARGITLAEQRGELLDPRAAILADAHSPRPDVKQANRRVERLLVNGAEPFALMAWTAGLLPWPATALDRAWKLLLQNQAHDSHACISSEKVYRQVLSRFEQAEDIAREIMQESLLALTNASGNPAERELALCVFNPLGHERDEIVTADIDIPSALGWKNFGIHAGDTEISTVKEDLGEKMHIRYTPFRGHPMHIPVHRWRVTFRCAGLPALGFLRLSLREAAHTPAGPAGSLISGSHSLENEFLRVNVQPDGRFDLTDKKSGRNYPGLHFFEDDGEAGDGFTHLLPVDDRKVLSIGLPAEISICRDTAHEAEIEICKVLPLPARSRPGCEDQADDEARCEIRTRLRLRAGSPRLDLVTSINNQACNHRLRVMFPTGIHDGCAVAGLPFDEARRPANSGKSSVLPFQGHIDITNGSHGLIFVSDDLCEYELTGDGSCTLALTLLRATDRIGCGFTNPEHLMPTAQSLGQNDFRYTIIPHTGEAATVRRETLNAALPPLVVIGRECEEASLPWYQKPGLIPLAGNELRGIKFSAPDIVLSAIKRHEDRDSIVLRLFNNSPAEKITTLQLLLPGFEIKEAWTLDLLEERKEPLVPDATGCYRLQFTPRGLCTVEFCREPGTF